MQAHHHDPDYRRKPLQQAVYKYDVPAEGNHLTLPRGYKVRHVGVQAGSIKLWIQHTEIDTAAEVDERMYTLATFMIRGTGHAFDPVDSVHLGTVELGPFVWHVFDTTEGCGAA